MSLSCLLTSHLANNRLYIIRYHLVKGNASPLALLGFLRNGFMLTLQIRAPFPQILLYAVVETETRERPCLERPCLVFLFLIVCLFGVFVCVCVCLLFLVLFSFVLFFGLLGFFFPVRKEVGIKMFDIVMYLLTGT